MNEYPTYVVVKQGIYTQDVYGPYELLTDAVCKAMESADADRDDYHTYDVRELSESGLSKNPLASYKKDVSK